MTINQNPGRTSADRVAINVRNAEASASIPVGSPVVMVMNATNDGIDVVLPSTSAALNKILAFRCGVTTRAMAAGDFGSAVVFGFHPSLLLLRQARTSSTVSWATEAARSVGEYLSIDTVNNMWVTAATTYTNTTGATVSVYPDAALAQTLASYAGSASATSDTRTAITAAVKAFVRVMG